MFIIFSYWFSHGVKGTVYATYGANDEAYVKGTRQPVQHQADPELQPCYLKNKQSWKLAAVLWPDIDGQRFFNYQCMLYVFGLYAL